MLAMYAWIWRHLPFGLPGRLAGSTLIIAALAASLWFWVFPWLEPLLPFDDVRVEPAVPGISVSVSPTPQVDLSKDPFAVPYSTETNNPPSPPPTLTPSPSPSPSPRSR